MALGKITDPDLLVRAPLITDLGTSSTYNIFINTATKEIQLQPDNAGTNLDSDGVSLQALYSYLKEEWRTDPLLIRFAFPMESITNEQFEFFNGWDLDATLTTADGLSFDGATVTMTAGGQRYLPGDRVQIIAATTDADDGYYIVNTVTDDTELSLFEIDGTTAATLATEAAGANTRFVGQTTRDLIRDGGWALRSGGTSLEEYSNITTLGAFDDSANDNAYYLQVADGTSQLVVLPGEVNQAVRVKSTFTGDTFDYSSYFNIYLREQGKTYGYYDLIGEQNITAGLVYKKYAMPLSNGTDLKVTNSDAFIALDSTGNHDLKAAGVITLAGAFTGLTADDIGSTITLSGATTSANNRDYVITAVTDADNITVTPVFSQIETGTGSNITTVHSGMDITWTPTVINFGGDDKNFAINITGNQGTAEQIYQFVQYKLRLDEDIDSLLDGHVGKIQPEMLAFVGDTLVTKTGVYITGFQVADTNRLTFTANDDSVNNWPFVAAGTISFNANLADVTSVAVYTMFFSNDDDGDNTGRDFDTANAIIVEQNSGVKTTGTTALNFTTALTITGETWQTAGYLAGDTLTISGSTNNDGQYIIDSVDDTTLTIITRVGLDLPNFTTGVDGSSIDLTTKNVSGFVNGASSALFDYDFDNNDQRGLASKETEAPITVVAIGTNVAQYVKATSTITRSTQNVITLVAPLERNYANA